MIRLIGAELLRLRSRKLTWIALGAVLLVVLLTQLAVYSSVRPLSDAERSQAQTYYQEALVEYEQNKADFEESEQQCRAEGLSEADCDSTPRLEWYAQRSVIDFAEAGELAVTVSVFVTALGLLFLSASVIGAEFSSGSMSNWLTFVPERTKVYASKLVALVLVGALVTAAASALAIGLTALVSRIVGASVTGLGPVAGMGGRGVLLGVIAVVVGFALAMLTRHTIAAAGTVLGYLFLSFVLNIVMLALPGLQRLKAVLPENNALALLNDDYKYTNVIRTPSASGTEEGYVEKVITFGEASLYWGLVTAVLLAASYLVFRRRDVS